MEEERGRVCGVCLLFFLLAVLLVLKGLGSGPVRW